MRKLTTLLLATACGAMFSVCAHAADSPVLKIENFIGTVEVQTGDFDKITVTDADGASPSKSGGDLTIDDGVSIKKYNCRYKNDRAYIGKGKWRWNVSNKGYTDIREFPLVKITAPRGTHLEIDNAIIFGTIGTVKSAHLHIGSCGDLTLADVTDELDIGISGSGDVAMGNAGRSDISVSGSGDLEARNLTSADIHVSGSGDLELGDILGAADIGSSGAGDIEIGRIGGGLTLQSSGASDFEADYVGGGDLSVRVSGSGDVTIKDGKVDKLYIKASGASDVTYDGQAVDAEARASGASDIYIHNPSGRLRISDSGAADVNVR